MISHDVEILARTIYGEARGEATAGKIAVANVVINRFKRRSWYSGDTIADTCTFCVNGSRYHQFSCWNTDDPTFRKVVETPAKALGECLEIAQKAVDGKLEDITHGSTHYHTLNISPKWAEGHAPAAIIGNHKFYNDVK